MKLQFPYKEGDIITVYGDWENELNPIGTAKLVELHSLGRSFILEDTYPEVEQIVYNYQEWIIGPIKAIFDTTDNTHPLYLHYWLHPNVYNVRYIDTIGIANSSVDELDKEDYTNHILVDKFITVNEKEIF